MKATSHSTLNPKPVTPLLSLILLHSFHSVRSVRSVRSVCSPPSAAAIDQICSWKSKDQPGFRDAFSALLRNNERVRDEERVLLALVVLGRGGEVACHVTITYSCL